MVPKYVNIARNWIRNCTHDHTVCNDGVSEDFLPTRLLDVGSPNDKLCTLRTTTNFPGGKYKYVTLSHSWGTAKFLKLEAGNFSRFESGIQLTALTKTFRDAISVTQGLGIRYLWIDALCIIQGPTLDDWAIEASRMCDVYRNSWCNISALWATDHQRGFLPLAQPDLSCWTTINIDWDDLGEPNDWVILDQSIWTEEVAKAPLNKRAWVLQERILPPRQLYFGRNDVLWQCYEFSSFSLVPDLCHPHSYTGEPFGNNLSEKFFERKRANGQKDALSLWAQYVDLYSVCALTKPEDKLVAIAGIAQDINRTFPADEYIVGVWRSQLPNQLMWRAEMVPVSGNSNIAKGSSTPEPLTIPSQPGDPAYRSPSWSWAYTQVPIVAFRDAYSHEQDIPLVDIKRTELNFTVPSLPYGQVLDARLVLHGIPIPVSHSIDGRRHKLSQLSPIPAPITRLTTYFDKPFSSPWNGNTECDRNLYLLPLRYTCWRTGSGAQAETTGLLLVRWKATINSRVQYSRVGMFFAFGVKNCDNFGVIFEEIECRREATIRERERKIKSNGYWITEDGGDGLVERESDKKLVVAKEVDQSRWEDIVLI